MKLGWRSGVLCVLATVAVVALLFGIRDDDGGGPSPFTASDSWVRAECLMGTYLPERVGWRVAEGPVPGDWSRIEDAPGALLPDRAAVELTLRPKEGSEKITLKGIRLEVDQHALRPLGIVFYRPCKRRLTGPAIEVDLAGAGEVTSSSAAFDETIGPGLRLSPSAPPIDFPWTIELSKPLRLYFVAHTESCYCTWSVRIPWEGESSHGVIHVDNGGRRYTMTDSVGVGWYRPGPNGRWVQGLAPRWIGVR